MRTLNLHTAKLSNSTLGSNSWPILSGNDFSLAMPICVSNEDVFFGARYTQEYKNIERMRS